LKKISLRDKISSLEGSQILLVEDNILNQKIITGILKPSGINIDIASDGLEGINKFKSKKDQYELILMDIQMPIMNGYEATKIIRDIDKNIPIISFTANVSDEDLLYSKILGMNDYLTKPIDVEKLFTILLKYISKKIDIKSDNENDFMENLPALKYLNIKKVVPSTLSNLSFYKCVALKFLELYKDFRLNVNADNFKERTHTLKGLAGTIGADKLYEIIVELENIQSEELLNSFHETLDLVCIEIEKNFYNESDLISCEQKRKVSLSELKNLIEELKIGLSTRRPKIINPILFKLEEVSLNINMEEMSSKIIKYSKEYEFDEAILALDYFLTYLNNNSNSSI
jgi:CheY-like chemotaxis protein